MEDSEMKDTSHIAIIGAGNIGISIANGLAKSGRFLPEHIILTRRRLHLLEDMRTAGFNIQSSNTEAVKRARTIVIAVEPHQIDGVLTEISEDLNSEEHIVISVVTAITIAQITRQVGEHVSIIRAMPNTAIEVGESMTCLASRSSDDRHTDLAESVFKTVGAIRWIGEEQMVAATALGACGIAFFLRAIRAASLGGIEIGFDSDTTLAIAAQTAKGAASLLLTLNKHPEQEIDRVATPGGCTIAGLNRMEHEGFSSAVIEGITASAERASQLYADDG
jgi:pyrroline-5-carboxylate reductase